MSVEALHAGLGWAVASGLVALSFATSFMAAAFGLGGGAVMLAVLATVLPAAAIIPIHGLVQLGSNAGRAAIMISHTHRAILPTFLMGAGIGVALGGVLLVQLPAAAIRIGVGLFVLWSVFGTPPAFMNRSAGVAGGISSFLTMFFGATGPFVAAYLRTLSLPKDTHVATHSVLMTVQHLLKCVAFGLVGFAFAQWLPLIAALIVAGFIGTLAGRAVLRRLDDDRFRRVLDIILIVLGLNLVTQGVAAATGLELSGLLSGTGVSGTGD
ncbi:MAG: TSUP family transporter [Pseudomonadota bacterium]